MLQQGKLHAALPTVHSSLPAAHLDNEALACLVHQEGAVQTCEPRDHAALIGRIGLGAHQVPRLAVPVQETLSLNPGALTPLVHERGCPGPQTPRRRRPHWA